MTYTSERLWVLQSAHNGLSVIIADIPEELNTNTSIRHFDVKQAVLELFDKFRIEKLIIILNKIH